MVRLDSRSLLRSPLPIDLTPAPLPSPSLPLPRSQFQIFPSGLSQLKAQQHHPVNKHLIQVWLMENQLLALSPGTSSIPLPKHPPAQVPATLSELSFNLFLNSLLTSLTSELLKCSLSLPESPPPHHHSSGGEAIPPVHGEEGVNPSGDWPMFAGIWMEEN